MRLSSTGLCSFFTLLLGILVACSSPTPTPPPTATLDPTPTMVPTPSAVPTLTPTPLPPTVPTAVAAPTPAPVPKTTSTAAATPIVSPTPALILHDPYSDGSPARFLWASYPPPPPEGLTAIASRGDSVFLEWQPVDDVAGYRVRYLLPPPPGQVIRAEDTVRESLPASQTSLLVSGLECQQNYSFYVSARGDGVPYLDDEGPYSRVDISPCSIEPAVATHAGGVCLEGRSCLSEAQWPPFTAIYQRTTSSRGNNSGRDLPNEWHVETRSQIYYIEWRADFDWKITVIADFIWSDLPYYQAEPSAMFSEIGSYEEQKGLIGTTYRPWSESGEVRRDEEPTYGGRYGDWLTTPRLLIDGWLTGDGIPENREGVCYRNVCEKENAVLRFDRLLVTNDRYRIPLEFGDSFRVLEIRIEAYRE